MVKESIGVVVVVDLPLDILVVVLFGSVPSISDWLTSSILVYVAVFPVIVAWLVCGCKTEHTELLKKLCHRAFADFWSILF